VSTYKICNFDLKARGVIPMQQILSQSLNLGASFIATKMGYPIFTNTCVRMVWIKKTGIDLPNEVHGRSLSARLWTEAGYQLRHAPWAGYIRLADRNDPRALGARQSGSASESAWVTGAEI